ncbi:hypothetical protein AB0K00_00350 [Dactylosporangium sp. NPDC049525]|uniref:hypothetical protein n=1 Tax=Dactylosporangium sp. NPDC049525 TaxID=3154730 RepID=UPI00343DDED6
MKSISSVAAVSIGLTAAAVVMGAQPASAAQASMLPATSAYTEAQQPRTAFVDPPGDLPAGTTVDASGTHTRRAYFAFDLTGFQGNSVSVAALSTTMTAEAACTVPVPVQLWRTGKLGRTPTWRNAPAELELLGEWAVGCDGWWSLSTSIAGTLAAAVGRGDRTLTLELRVAQAAEATAGTGLLVTKPQLLVTHNAIPVVRNPGLVRDGRCGTTERPRPANRTAGVAVTATDADGGTPAVTFTWWPLAAPEQRHDQRGPAGGTYLDLNGLAEGTVIAWAAQAYDGTDTSAWSKTCYLVIDLTPPATLPLVSSADFPQDGEPHGQVGVAGTFTLDARGDRDVIGFVYLNGGGDRRYVYLEQPGGTATITYTPLDSFPTFEAGAIDLAGNEGERTVYEFMVNY